MTVVRVTLPDRSYPILIGPEVLAGLGSRLTSILRGRDLVVIADSRVFRLHGALLKKVLGSDFRVAFALVPPGERSKTLATAQRLYQDCRRHGLGRDGAVVAFGGGVIGDLAGFVAATWLRGVDLVMIPTTLLAQVDSSIGGKVGVNFDGLKNMIGAFHQPRLVVSDTRLLETLPRREMRSALAEVVKYGMIADAGLFRALERNTGAALSGDSAFLSRIVTASARIKAKIVAADERETGIREILNYGHTLGHAIEGAALGRLRHGEAVALGMRGAARIAEESGYITAAVRERQDRLLDRLGLPGRIGGLEMADVYGKIKLDKKIRARKPRFVLTRSVGSARLAEPVDKARVRRALATLLT